MSLLQVRDLVKQYGNKTAINNLNFDVGEGRCVALLGPNGAGKTTTLNIIAGLATPTNGTLKFAGMKEKQDIRRYIGYLPQYPAFFGWMSGKEFLMFVGKLASVDKRILKTKTDELLKMVGLYEARNRKISGYSGGMKQRLGIAQAMIHSPKLLILDEPVSALDPIGRREVLEMMQQLKKHTTILFSTHILNDAEEISDDILIISNGEIVLNNSLIKVKEQAQQPTISVHFETAADTFLTLFDSLDFIKEVHTSGFEMTFSVVDIDHAKRKLLKIIAENEIPIQKFKVAEVTLEELFMKAVQQ